MILFGIIYTVDCHPSESVQKHAPVPRRKWRITEREPDGTYDLIWGKGYHHRKYVAVLTKEQFKGFVDHLNLCASTVETMGSLGAPAPNEDMALGIVPAVSFDSRSDEYELGAYVTPYVVRANPKRNEGEDRWLPVRAQSSNERDWDRLRDAMLATWTDYPKYVGQFSRLRSARLSETVLTP